MAVLRSSFAAFLCIVAITQFQLASAVLININPAECVEDFLLSSWSEKRFGPYTICLNGRVNFQWRGMHGVFQIPSIACPSNFTASEAETYKFLAPASNGGGYEWQVPNKTGHYWVTSQWANDCKNGMIAEFYVVDRAAKPFRASATQASTRWVLVSLAMAVLLAAGLWF